MSGSDERFMRRALALACSVPFTSPNPRVGAVVARGGAVLGEGAHLGYGHPHAERVALSAAGDVRGATLYCNLEPCDHLGATPPCAPAVIEAGIARVVVAHTDPDARVAGRGLERLRGGALEVRAGVLADDALRLNAPYVHHRTTGRSFVTLKLALTLDGRLGARDGSSRWISGELSRARVHERRAEVDAVMVGAGTVAADDPRLTSRHPTASRQPARVVVDSSGRTPTGAAVFSPGARVIVATTDAATHEVQTEWKEAGAEVVVLPGDRGAVDLWALLERLGAEGMLEVLCEGGARLATSLLRADLVERLELYYGPLLMGSGGASLGDMGVGSLAAARRWRMSSMARRGDDAVIELHRAAR